MAFEQCQKTQLDLRFQGAGEHKLGDENNVLLLAVQRFPVVVKPHNVGMLQLLQHLGLFSEPRSFDFVHLFVLWESEKKYFKEKRREDEGVERVNREDRERGCREIR